MKRLTKIGLALTAVWVAAFCVVIYLHINDTTGMTLNEWGDFLAGAFAPLALFWLVIGYFQHGEELRLNTRALETQEEELRRQVEETARLVDATREEVGFLQERDRREAMPDLVSTGGGAAASDGTLIDLQNRGAEVRDIAISYEGSYDLTFSPNKIWESNKTGRLTLRHPRRQLPDYPIRFSLSCVDLAGYKHTFECELLDGYVIKKLAHDYKKLADADKT